MRSLFSQPFAVDIPGDAIAVGEFVFDFLSACFDDYAVDGFIRQVVCEGALAQPEKSAQAKAESLIFFARPLRLGMEPGEKTRKLFPSYFFIGVGND